ncbi:AP-3 adaptor complex subunit Apl5 [Schizosaccharomyces cryophilus OY26]|uniref:AP-3 complex subunit delta n=1 Tax=Schizosaccharomyces cryophilus (strain OY26 / ATCC MYA-4695 / CBS 11777 / NBRC 106824 / NRRL Y48691) TaxID=653667 RepID=S9VW49_SCHCR|nr:AP-3 adaptor complex subunit Apl5 [Schizosaccharomyces cryophilus OY26]EPY50315.1 AP-3 adaptor complex subunit Apl5 [Schizosaccharomyces cryophilus OY26]
MVFEKSLNDLIKGIRSHRDDEDSYVNSCLLECRKEVSSQDAEIKAEAALKLAYLEMFGNDVSWASFQIIEVMASSQLSQKQRGYLAAVQSFKPTTDVLMLTTNLIKKDIMSSKVPEITIAINGLSHISTYGLARDLYQDVLILLNHSVPYVRKRTIMVLYRLCLQYPDAIPICVPKLRERLDDTDISVVNASVSVICELARRTPKNYLEFAPDFFHLLTNSSNNWMLIKLVKLFASLTPYEPRLVKKLVPALTQIIETTHAMSLLYECINTIVSGNMLAGYSHSDRLAWLCATKLREFFLDSDQNLKYVALLSFNKLANTHQELVAQQLDIILQCLVDSDTSLRMRALDLVCQIVNAGNIVSIVKTIMLQLVASSEDVLNEDSRTITAHKLVEMTSKSNYAVISDFEWLLSVYVDLSRIPGIHVGKILSFQIVDICVRVKALRPFAIDLFSQIITDPSMIFMEGKYKESSCEVLPSLLWCLGEYAEYIEEYIDVLDGLVRPTSISLPNNVQAILIQSIPKIFCQWCVNEEAAWNTEKLGLVKLWVTRIQQFMESLAHSLDMESQIRAVEYSIMFAQIQEVLNTDDYSEILRFQKGPPYIIKSTVFNLFFTEPFNPVATKAQKRVLPPEGLDLDTPINGTIEVPKKLMDMIDESIHVESASARDTIGLSANSSPNILRTKESIAVRDLNSPFYLNSSPFKEEENTAEDDTNGINEVTENDSLFSGSRIMKVTKKSRRRKVLASPIQGPVEVAQDEIPEGVHLSDEDQLERSKIQQEKPLISLDPTSSAVNDNDYGRETNSNPTIAPIKVQKKEKKKKKNQNLGTKGQKKKSSNKT